MHIDDIDVYSISFDKNTEELRVTFAFDLYDERPGVIFRLKNGLFVGYDYEDLPNYSKQKKNKIINQIKKSKSFDHYVSIVEKGAEFEKIASSDQTVMVQKIEKCQRTDTFDIYFKIKEFDPLFAIIFHPESKEFSNLRLVEGYIFADDFLNEEHIISSILKDPKCRLKLLFR